MNYELVVGLGNHLAKDPKPYTTAVFIAAGVTLVLFFVFIPVLGKEGAALGMLLGQLVVPIYIYKIAQKKWYIPYKPWFSIVLYSFALIVYLIQSQFSAESLFIEIFSKLALLAFYALFMLMLLKQTDKEIFIKINLVFERLKARK